MDIRKYEQIADKLRESWSITDEKQEIIIKEESADAITELVAHIKSTPESEQKPVAYMTKRGAVYAGSCFGPTDTPLYPAPQPDYKAQRDALLKALDDIAWNRKLGDRRSPSALLQDVERMALAAIASVKGGA